MNRVQWIVPLVALAAGCVVHPVQSYPPPAYAPAPPPPEYVPPPAPVVVDAPPPVAPLEVWYFGEHFVPDRFGGGWCYDAGPHVHDYFPERMAVYTQENGYFIYRGPMVFSYYEGHPLPGGGWCMIRGPHTHEYAPPRHPDFEYRRDRGYVYVGAYRANRPPPPTYWPARPPVRQGCCTGCAAGAGEPRQLCAGCCCCGGGGTGRACRTGGRAGQYVGGGGRFAR